MGIYSLVDKRASRALDQIVQPFESILPIVSQEGRTVVLDGSRYGFPHVKAYHKLVNKWMGRIYLYTWEYTLPGISHESDIGIKLQYRGSMRTGSKPSFSLITGDTTLDQMLNQDEALLKLCSQMDFQRMEIQYKKSTNEWNVQIAPNYGDFMWVLIPPVSYSRKPNADEVNNTIQTLRIIAEYIQTMGSPQ
ncbi:hypothetical protein NV379_17390 [Paenibacillus sp. N1-5-1-14]|uniref:hypothetical protein n=1 Tax=Paenibacillus radicibacter TaxID=2972488 RepID=UPI002158AA00|nr:hypothetical protein [Paenibacillus radicibacter]MCR8644431.1 hypothetical protein [Paenibacillus radicibacter]